MSNKIFGFPTNPLAHLMTLGKETHKATAWAFSLFKTHLLEPLEDYAIGDLRKGGLEKVKPVDLNTQQTNLNLRRFGKLFSIAFWQPSSAKELEAALKTVDAQPYARIFYSSPRYFTDAPFFLEQPANLGLVHRAKILPFLSDTSKYGKVAWSLLFNEQEHSLTDFTVIPLLTVAQELLGIDPKIMKKHSQALQKLAKDFKKHTALLTLPFLLKYSPSLKEIKAAHTKAVEDLLRDTIENIKQPSSSSKEGLLKEKILEKLKTNPNGKNLHQDPELKSLILTLLALDNLEAVLRLMDYVFNNIRPHNDLLQEIDKAACLTNDNNTLHPEILMNKEMMPYLHTCYEYCLRNTFKGNASVVMFRYVHYKMQIGSHEIPSRTCLMIQPHSLPKEDDKILHASSPFFSIGRRKCPGERAAEMIFKTMAVGFVIKQENYRLVLTEKLEKAYLKNAYQRPLELIPSLVETGVETIRDMNLSANKSTFHIIDVVLENLEIYILDIDNNPLFEGGKKLKEYLAEAKESIKKEITPK